MKKPTLRLRARHGLSLLVMVLFFAAAASLVVIAVHVLWRGSSRTLFSIQENRQLINLGRSGLAEGYYELQRQLDQGQLHWLNWFTARGAAPDRTFLPARTSENAELMSADARFLQYRATDVHLVRIQRLGLREAAEGKMGVIDLQVEVTVKRTNPPHEHALTMLERRTFTLADNHGPFASGGRHVAISPTPAATWIEEK